MHKSLDVVYLTNKLHTVRTQFDNMMELATLRFEERDDQADNDADKERQMTEWPLNEKNYESR